MIELKRCPFCGGAVRYNYNLDGEPTSIWCEHCHCLTTFSRIRAKRGDNFGKVMEKMAEAYNKRADEAGMISEGW